MAIYRDSADIYGMNGSRSVGLNGVKMRWILFILDENIERILIIE